MTHEDFTEEMEAEGRETLSVSENGPSGRPRAHI